MKAISQLLSIAILWVAPTVLYACATIPDPIDNDTAQNRRFHACCEGSASIPPGVSEAFCDYGHLREGLRRGMNKGPKLALFTDARSHSPGFQQALFQCFSDGVSVLECCHRSASSVHFDYPECVKPVFPGALAS